MFKLNVSLKEPSKIKEFNRREYKFADLEHYGFETDWTEKKFVITALEGKEMVGVVQLQLKVGVAEIHNMLVAHNKQGQGIGRMLMNKIEEVAKKEGAHKIFLETGKGWGSEKFYQKLGYQKTGKLANHYLKRDFVEYTKFL